MVVGVRLLGLRVFTYLVLLLVQLDLPNYARSKV